MKRIILYILSFLPLCSIYAQVETRYYVNKDAGKSLPQIINDNTPIVRHVSILDNDALKNEENKDKDYYCYSKFFDVNYSLADGMWKDTVGGRIWTLTIESTDATSIGFIFNKFFLPDSAYLYMINSENTMLYGPVTNKSIADNIDFVTDELSGSCVTLLLYEPECQIGNSILEISKLIHGFTEYDEFLSINRDASCYLQVACEPGWDLQADATGRFRAGNGKGSGVLVMTTNNSFKGYFLTAKHNLDSGTPYRVDFFYRYSNCNGNDHLSKITCYNVVLRASWSTTDMALMEILDLPADNPELAWLGWDRSGSISHGAACIHYPYGTEANIALEEDNVVNYDNNYWKVTWDVSTTQPGSSGAPLLNSERKVIGQLTGHVDNENLTTCERLKMKFGKFNKSWTGGGTDDTRLSNWLDPIGTGQTSIGSRRKHNPVLVGPKFICSDSVVYTISDFPNSANVVWSFSFDFGNAQPTIQGSGNTCVINNNTSKSYVGTLHAKIYWGNYLLNDLSLKVVSYAGFYGVYNGNQQFYPNNSIWIDKGSTICLKSPNMVYKNVSYLNQAPSIWNYYNFAGELYVGYPNITGNQPIVIHIQNDNNYSDCDNEYYVAILPTTLLPYHTMNTSIEKSAISIEMITHSSEEVDASPFVLSLLDKEPIWKLEIYNALSGQNVFRQTVNGKNYKVNTTGWNRGVYIIKAIICGEGSKIEELTDKVVLN